MSADHKPYDLIAAYDRFAEWFQALDEVYYDPDKTKRLADLIETQFKGSTRELMSQSISVLDCACGVGSAAIDLAKAGFRVSCSDASSGMLRYAKENAQTKAGPETDRIGSIRLFKSDWCDLEVNVPGTFDCVMNLGVNLYHLHGQDLTDALAGMKAKLRPNGFLLIDNKRWHEISILIDGTPEVCLTEKRGKIRVFNADCPLPRHAAEKYYFFDMAWSEGRQYVMTVIRISAREIKQALHGKSAVHLNVCGQSVAATIHDGKFSVDCCGDSTNQAYEPIAYEAIPLKGWPVRSSEIKSLMEDIGLQGVVVNDYYETLYGNSKPEKRGLYDLIVARQVKEQIEDSNFHQLFGNS
jgi:SAM-dependent methyltransferase